MLIVKFQIECINKIIIPLKVFNHTIVFQNQRPKFKKARELDVRNSHYSDASFVLCSEEDVGFLNFLNIIAENLLYWIRLQAFSHTEFNWKLFNSFSDDLFL